MFGVKLFAKTHSHLLIQTDSITAIRYVNKIGGTHSKTLCDLSLEIHKRCVIHNIRLTAEHLPGKDNTLADRLSRQSNQDWSDLKLSPTVFNHILVTTQLIPSIDLFASRLNAQNPTFMSWNGHTYTARIFPPMILIGQVLAKLMKEQVQQAILIVPHWPSRP